MDIGHEKIMFYLYSILKPKESITLVYDNLDVFILSCLFSLINFNIIFFLNYDFILYLKDIMKFWIKMLILCLVKNT